MILTMIITIAVAVLLAVFIGKNLAYSTSIWFFKDFGETNVAVIVLITFAAGIVFALLCILLGKIIKDSKAVEKENEKAKIIKEVKKENKKGFKDNNEKPSLQKSAEVKPLESKNDEAKATQTKAGEKKAGFFEGLFSFGPKNKAAPKADEKKDEADNGKANV